MGRKTQTYRRIGQTFDNISYSSTAERAFVRKHLSLVAKTLKTLRIDMGISQEALAEAVSASVGTIKFIEQQQRVPSLPMLLKILYVLDKKNQFFKLAL